MVVNTIQLQVDMQHQIQIQMSNLDHSLSVRLASNSYSGERYNCLWKSPTVKSGIVNICY